MLCLSAIRARKALQIPLLVASTRCYQVKNLQQASGSQEPPNTEEAIIIQDATAAAANRMYVSTAFVSPNTLAEVFRHASEHHSYEVFCWGGYPQAERCRMLLGHPLAVQTAVSDVTATLPLQVVEIRGDFLFDPPKKEDFFDAAAHLAGVSASDVGDILLMELDGAQLIATPAAADKIVAGLTEVIGVPVECRTIVLSDLAAPPPHEKEIASSEASMRLDAIASAGFGISRSKAAAAIRGGQVRVNWCPAARVANEVVEGDVIAMEGRGRVVIEAVEPTKKGRFQVLLRRIS